MKTRFSLPVLLSLFFGLSCTISIRAQVFRLVSQEVWSGVPLVASANTLYGTEYGIDPLLKGEVFKIETDGTGFALLHSFTGPDGANPAAALLLLGNTLYGTAANGGSSSNGTVFKVNVDGTGFTTLHSFTAVDGASPASALVSSDGILYGTAQHGGTSGHGTIFALRTDGTAFTNLYSFDNGAVPKDLTLSGTTLYGTSEFGSVFAIKTDGTGFTNLHYFSSDDGHQPGSPLLLSGKTLYGTTSDGGQYHNGVVFAVDIDGSGFRKLHTFAGYVDGTQPSGALVLWNDTLYGTTLRGLLSDTLHKGTVFAVDTNGTSFATLHMFNVFNEGGSPASGLTFSGDKLYGATGLSVYSITLGIPLAIGSFEGNLILEWPTHPSGFILQFTTNLQSPIWTTISTPPAVLNGQNTVLSPITGPQQFYRLVSQ